MTRDLDRIFSIVKKQLQQFSPPLTASRNAAGTSKDQYSLVSKKEAVVAGRKRTEVWFAAVIRQKAFVGFYFMPVYADPAIKRIFQPELLSLLKGKSCFHLNYLGDKLEKQIARALKQGYAEYKKNGWV